MASTGDTWQFGRRPNNRLRAALVVGLALTLITALVALGQHSRSGVDDPYLWFADEHVENRAAVEMINGLPTMTYPGIDGPQVNPVTIEQWGLSHYSRGDLATALRAADWLVAHQRKDGAWTYGFDFFTEPSEETLRAPWVSGLAQGEALSLLVRTWRATGQDAYLATARAALEPFTVPVEDGGVLRMYRGHPWYEEYPTRNPSMVLNGYMSTLIGLHEFAQATGNHLAQRLWTEGERSVAALISEFAVGEHDSAYALAFKNPGGPPPTLVSTNGYAKIQVDLVEAMYQLTGRPVYRDMAQAWSGQLPKAPMSPSAGVALLVLWLALAAALLLLRRRRLQSTTLSDDGEPRLALQGLVGGDEPDAQCPRTCLRTGSR